MTDDKEALRVRLINIICGDVFPTYNHVTKADMVIATVEEPLRARIAELEAALKPFADCGVWDGYKDEEVFKLGFKIADLRAARAAYLGGEE